MQNILQRAWRDTYRSYGLSRQEIARKAVAAIGTVGILYLIFGGDVATSEAWVIAATLVAAAAGTFVPEFLWNLWLAPYRIMHDQLDKIAAAQPSNSVVNEAAQERTLNYHKTRTALAEMKALRRCIDARETRSFEPLRGRDSDKEFDHRFLTLTEKYSDWLPSDIAERDMRPWVGRTITTLNAYEYPDAKERIEQAVSAGTWKAAAE